MGRLSATAFRIAVLVPEPTCNKSGVEGALPAQSCGLVSQNEHLTHTVRGLVEECMSIGESLVTTYQGT